MDTSLLDPELVPFAGAVPVLELNDEFIAGMRGADASSMFGPPPELSDAVERTDHVVSESPHVSVRVHRPRGIEGALPCLFSIHGGGYVFGSVDMDDLKFDTLCPKLGIVGVSVEYRLAPETAYPGPLDDCYAALKWTFEHAAELGIDAGHIGISGVSAGGGLAAALGLMVRDRGEIPVRFQLLECPMLDDRQTTSSSQRDGMIIWSRESNTYGWKSYLGELYGSADIPAYAAAARATDLGGLPETMVIVGGADGFRDEDITYATRLGNAGVPTDLHVLAGAPHGVQLFAGTRLAKQWTTLVTEWLTRQLAR